MLKKELVKYLQPFPDDAEIFTEIKQDTIWIATIGAIR